MPSPEDIAKSFKADLHGKVQEAKDKVKDTLGVYAHVRETIRSLPELSENTSRAEFIVAVKAAPIRVLPTASARAGYVEYLEGLSTENWGRHLRSALHMQKHARSKRALRLQGTSTIQASGGNVQISVKHSSRDGDERTRDGED
jgi:hypothetical protein